MESAGESLLNFDQDDENVLNDKILDPVNANGNVFDEQVTVKAFCSKCRTISSSFLSSPSLPPAPTFETVSRNRPRLVSLQGGNNFPTAHDQSDFYVSSFEDDTPLITNINDENHIESGIGICPTSAEHCHPSKIGKRKSQRRAITKLIIACCLTFIFMIGEGIGGYLANSVAVMSDAAHMLSDFTSFIVSLVAIFLAARPPSRRMSFGFQRAEILGAILSVVLIWLITGVLIYVAIGRVISMDFEVEGDTMIIVSAIGILFNIILGIVLHSGGGSHGHSHGSSHSHATSNQDERNVNIRAAMIHVLGDLIQSIGVLTSAYIIRFYPQYKIADPVCTFLFSFIVGMTTVPIIKDLSLVLMEATPLEIDYLGMNARLGAIPGVKMVHSLHIWSLTLDKVACSVHLAIGPESRSERVLNDAQQLLRRHLFSHTTIQVEQYNPQVMDNCQQCQPIL